MNGELRRAEARATVLTILSLAWPTIVEQVMQTARKAGATGGTVIRSRLAGAENPEQFHGVALQAEKDCTEKYGYLPLGTGYYEEKTIK